MMSLTKNLDSSDNENNLEKQPINNENNLKEQPINDNTYVEIPEWVRNKHCTINPKSNDNKSFQYSIILSLYHKEIGKNPQRIATIKPFINSFNWNNINFPPTEQDNF